MACDVLIGGLDRARAKLLEVEVRRTILELHARDVVTIAVLPSDATNRWDVGVRRAGRWSVTWFDSSVDDLVARVTDTLRHGAADPGDPAKCDS